MRAVAARKEANRLVTVCSACLTAACWNGEFCCQDHLTAGTVERTVRDLRALGQEHPDNWRSR
jgi:hypothetical protein